MMITSVLHCRPLRPVLREKGRVRGKREGDDLDFVERLFAGVFGKKSLEDPEPFGLKRMSAERKKRLYPATTEEFAAPIQSDVPEVAAFRPMLAQTILETVELRCAYDASVHGWSYSGFHQCVDGFGAAVVVARSQGGAVFGGYNPRGLIYAESVSNLDSPLSLRVDWTGREPRFKRGLSVHMERWRYDATACKTTKGTYYERLPDGGRTLFGEGESTKGVDLTELKVYVAVGEGEEWELDGVVWKTKWRDGQSEDPDVK